MQKTYLKVDVYSAAGAFYPKLFRKSIKCEKQFLTMKTILKHSAIFCRWHFFTQQTVQLIVGNMKVSEQKNE